MNSFNSIIFRKLNIYLFLFSLASLIFIIDYWNGVIVLFIYIFLCIYFLFLKKITDQSKELQIFDLRIIVTSIIIIYTLIPLIGWCISGFDLNVYSDNRIRSKGLNSKKLFIFYFNTYLPFFLTFILGILLVNKKNNINNSIKINKSNALIVSTFICLIIFYLFFIYVGFAYEGIEPPLIIKQLNNIFSHYRRVCYFLVFLIVFLNWKYSFSKLIILIFLSYYSFLLYNGEVSRTIYFKQLLAIILAYTLIVKPIKLKYVVYISSIFIPLAILVGAKNNNMITIVNSFELGVASNEWWSVFGTAYDIYNFHINGFFNYTTDQITNIIPNTILYSEIYFLIPQQFIFKVDPSLWYLDYIDAYKGKDKFGIGFTWGSIATITLWNNIYFTFFYGLLSGFIIGLIHNYYTLYRDSIYVTLIYLCACIYSYGIIRVGTGYFLYEIIYRVVPFIFILIIMTNIFEILSTKERKIS